MQRLSPNNAFSVLMTSGFVTVPGILLREYKRLGLSENEMMLLLQLIQFRQEGVAFPTALELSGRMTLSTEMITSMVQQLMNRGFLDIETSGAPGYGEESLSIQPLYEKLQDLLQANVKVNHQSSLDLLEKKDSKNLFSLFEQEFGRPLSPIEYERIACWIDEDMHREELIREALREAVLAGKFNFRYIDRILFEWGKNNIRSLQDLTVHREQFRNRIPTRGQNSRSTAAAKQAPTPETGNKYDMFYKVYGGQE